MTQNELLYILTIAEHGNITRAAQELFISQPSLSESLNKVEQEFGTTIFDRTQVWFPPPSACATWIPPERSWIVLSAWRQSWMSTARCAAESSPSVSP